MSDKMPPIHLKKEWNSKVIGSKRRVELSSIAKFLARRAAEADYEKALKKQDKGKRVRNESEPEP